MTQERLDLIIFGATGFTGKHTVKEAARLCRIESFTWGVAGRNKERVEAVIKEFAPEFAQSCPVIIADTNDEESLKLMVKKCKVLVSCCGPYRHYGEPVVKACVSTGTHYVDVSGEPQFIETMQLKYNKAAQEAKAFIISACGIDSIPCDLGIIFAQQNFDGDVNSIETYLSSWITGDVRRGAAFHFGTWESGVHGAADFNKLRELRSKLYPTKLPKFTPQLAFRGLIHRSEVSQGWSVPFPGVDGYVAYRSQRFLYENNKIRPAQVQTYVTFKSFRTVLSVACVGIVFALMTRCKCGQNLLLKHPKFFSGGFASHEGPPPETMEKTHFSITLKASGWKNKLAEPIDRHVGSHNKEMVTKVSGVNPVYGATCTMLMIAALTILRESDKMPKSGGVLSPGAAFANTSMIQQLQNNGMKFEVIKTTEL